MSEINWKRCRLEGAYYRLKRDQVLYTGVQSALASQEKKLQEVTDNLRASLERLNVVYRQLLGQTSTTIETDEGPVRRGEPLGEMCRVINHLREQTLELEESIQKKSQILQELNMEQEQVAEDIEQVSKQIAQVDSADPPSGQEFDG